MEFGIIAGGIVLAALVGLVVGWVLRGSRATAEKAALNSSWRDQLVAQKTERDRLVGQNSDLMEKISGYRSVQSEADGRAKSLAESLKEAFAAKDRLKEELDVARRECAAAREELDEFEARRGAASGDREKDQKIFKLSRELESWRHRLPPLLEKYRRRDIEAQQLEIELDVANARIEELERRPNTSTTTRIERFDDPSLAVAVDASNEQFGEDSALLPTADGTPEGDSDGANGNAANGAGAGSAAPDSVDDLKAIKGVGPAIEKILNGLGIYRFGQIADMSEAEIDRVASELRGFRSRIYREDWIGQARMLDVVARDARNAERDPLG